MKAKDLKVGDEVFVDLYFNGSVFFIRVKVKEVEPNSDHNRQVGVRFEDINRRFFFDPEAELEVRNEL